MSKISLAPDASGTGIFTIASPNSNTNRTLTLPDNAGTIITSGTAGTVLQVVEASASSQISNSTTTYADTNLTATITPTSSSNKVLVLVAQPVFAAGGAAVGYGFQVNMGVRLMRGASVLQTPADDSGGKYSSGIAVGAAPASGVIGVWSIVTFNYLDSPATTSATTYKTQFAKGTAGMVAAYVNGTNGPSRIILMEIAA
jgi:hypothetical protein